MRESRETILKCARTNMDYMRVTPAGQQGYGSLVRLYERIARESLDCAQAWADDKPCPPHEPATDAFWWAVAVWAVFFSADVVLWAAPPGASFLHHEVEEAFARPHVEFANWLRSVCPGDHVYQYQYPWTRRPSPGVLILEHDAAWTQSVIRLTARWGLGHHLKDLLALGQSLLLMRRLRRGPWDPVAKAFLESDLVFLRELFGHFNFSPELRGVLDRFLVAAREEVAHAK